MTFVPASVKKTMARPRRKAHRGVKPVPLGKPAEQWLGKPLVLQMRGSEAWAQWVSDLAWFDRTDKSGVVDRALAFYARFVGFKAPPER